MAITFGKKVSKDAEWTTYTNLVGESCELLIGRATSPEFLKATEEVERPWKKMIKKERITPEKRRELNAMILAKSVLLDWKGIVDEDGKEIPYQAELGYQAMVDDPEMMEHVLDFAADSSNFALDDAEGIAKKSSKPSSGKSTTAKD